MECKIVSKTDNEVRVELTIPPLLVDTDARSLSSAQILELVRDSGLVKKGWNCTESPSYMSNLRESRRRGVCVFKKPVPKPRAKKKPPVKARKSDDA